MPIVFICEDNGIGISVATEEDWIENNFSNRYGLEYIKVDGLDLVDLIVKSKKAEKICRVNRGPVFLHMKTIRLMGHAGSDIEVGYKSLKEIEEDEKNDPLLHSARIMIENNCLSKTEILSLYEQSRKQIGKVFEYAISRPKLKKAKEVMSSIISTKHIRSRPGYPSLSKRKKIFDREFNRTAIPQHMGKLINYALTDILLQYPNTVVFGEDVAQKGGVYHVTADLYRQFGILSLIHI